MEEIKSIFEPEERRDEVVFAALKKKEIEVKVQKFEDTLHQIDSDISNLRKENFLYVELGVILGKPKQKMCQLIIIFIDKRQIFYFIHDIFVKKYL